MKQKSPQWQPIGKLSLIASMIDGMLESANEQYANLQEARKRPHVLDDYTVGRVREVYTTQKSDLWLYDEQLNRWNKGTLTPIQRKEVERLANKMEQLHEVITRILTLADELAKGTIEKVLAKSDVELVLEYLLGSSSHEHKEEP